jgi:phosphoserine phosphatase RsbU/P
MIEPKEFYRKLDIIQNKIGKNKSGNVFLFDIVDELEIVFGTDLHIGKGIIYEQVEGEYLLISNPEREDINIAEKIDITNDAVKLLIKNKVYIFDNSSLDFPGWENKTSDYKIPATIIVSSLEHSWIFLFELQEGWQREEIEFCFNAVRTALKFRLISDSVQNEMERAVHIQKSLLPESSPDKKGYDIAGQSTPAELVGGDIYDYFEFDDTTFGFCIGDASGHGLPAALLARDAVTGLRMGLEKQMKMVHTLKKLNHVIYRSVLSSRFISLFYGELEDDGNLFYVNAGHPSPLLFSNGEVKELESTGIVFGALPEIELGRSFVRMENNSVLLLFSDGIFERTNSSGMQYGMDRLKLLVEKNLAKTSKEMIDLIFEDVKIFGNNKSLEDDATIVVIKRL